MAALLNREALEEEIRFASAQLRDLTNDEWGTTRVMWENRLGDLRDQLSRLAGAPNAEASIALVFKGSPVIGEREIKLDFATQALDSYQKIVALSLASQQANNIELKGPVKSTDKSRLYIRDLVRGSMGFLLEERTPEQTPLFDTPLKRAVESASALFSALSSDDALVFESAVEGAQGRLLEAIQRFSKLLLNASATAELVDDSKRVDLSEQAIQVIVGRLSEIAVEEMPETIAGVLLGILPESHQFELYVPSLDQTIKGSITDDLAIRYRNDATISGMALDQVVAQITTVRTFRRGALVKEQRILEEVSPTSARLLGFAEDDAGN